MKSATVYWQTGGEVKARQTERAADMGKAGENEGICLRGRERPWGKPQGLLRCLLSGASCSGRPAALRQAGRFRWPSPLAKARALGGLASRPPARAQVPDRRGKPRGFQRGERPRWGAKRQAATCVAEESEYSCSARVPYPRDLSVRAPQRGRSRPRRDTSSLQSCCRPCRIFSPPRRTLLPCSPTKKPCKYSKTPALC